MYPPAALDFDAALRTSAALPSTLRRPDLVNADMVVQREHLARMDDITLKDAGFEPDRPVHIALVGVPLEEGQRALDALRALDRPGRKIPCRALSLEATLGAQARLDDDTTRHRIETLAEECRAADATLYVEPRWPEPLWDDRIDTTIGALADVAPPVGLKVRCAGPTALGATTLARIAQRVVSAAIPLKATQGLHHPIVETRRYGNPVGFLGLAVALRLAADLPTDTLAACIAEADPRAFRFGPDELTWRNERLARAALSRRIQDVPFQIGSCSLHEPDDDLSRLYG